MAKLDDCCLFYWPFSGTYWSASTHYERTLFILSNLRFFLNSKIVLYQGLPKRRHLCLLCSQSKWFSSGAVKTKKLINLHGPLLSITFFNCASTTWNSAVCSHNFRPYNENFPETCATNYSLVKGFILTVGWDSNPLRRNHFYFPQREALTHFFHLAQSILQAYLENFNCNSKIWKSRNFEWKLKIYMCLLQTAIL